MLRSKYEEIDRMNINVGDEIYTLRYPSFGWSRQFTYPIVIKHKVAKITPKRTKITTEKGVELSKDCRFYKLNDALIRDSKIANDFAFFIKHNTDISLELLSRLTDDTIVKVSGLLKEAIEIVEKDENYIKMQEKK